MNSYLKELREYLTDFSARCRASRWLGALFHVRVCADIAADIEAMKEKAAQRAYDAEQADLLAARDLTDALADGLDESDEPVVRRALASLNRSANYDREISTLLTT